MARPTRECPICGEGVGGNLWAFGRHQAACEKRPEKEELATLFEEAGSIKKLADRIGVSREYTTKWLIQEGLYERRYQRDECLARGRWAHRIYKNTLVGGRLVDKVTASCENCVGLALCEELKLDGFILCEILDEGQAHWLESQGVDIEALREVIDDL